MKRFYRLTALLLAFVTVLPLIGVPSIAAEAGAVLFSDDFERFADYAEGTRVTQKNGFAAQIPSTTAVAKNGENTYLRIDLASSRNPSDTVYYKNDSSYTLVSKDTPGAIETDAASYGLISGNDENIDKGLEMKTPQISYSAYGTIMFEMDYYLSADANGTIHSQIRRFSSAETGSGAWLALYDIDTETGVWNVVGGARQSNEKLVRGAWNRIAMVIDLNMGLVDYYLNNALYAENASLGYTKITLDANEWIIGKIHRTRMIGQIAAEELNGFFGVDNVKISVYDEKTVTTVDDENASGEKLSEIEIYRNGTKIGVNYEQRSFLCSEGYSVRPVYFDATPYEGVVISTAPAELRMNEVCGLRYVSDLDIEKYAALADLKNKGLIRDVSIGTMIIPRFFGEVKGALESTTGNVKVPVQFGAWYSEDRAEEGIYSFAGTLANLGTSHYDDEFIGVGYVAATLQSGEIVYYYGDYDRSGTSLMDLAEKALASDASLDDDTREHLQSFISVEYEDAAGEVTEISYLGNRLFFRLGEDVYLCLSYTGNDAWRLRAHDGKYLGFEGAGAAQALARYMNEEPNEACEPLSLDFSGETVTVRSVDASYVTMSLGNDFSMRVYNASGKEVVCLKDISIAGDQIVMKGALENGEAVFGGGERFDSVNQRGKTIRLYTKDGWNDSGSTYMAIPLFSTSRGGGFYINRYEDAIADIGNSVKNRWELSLKNDRMDCYLFATEKITEVIEGYTKLTGNADVPEEWSYGVMICRYGPDFTYFDKDLDEENRDGAPSGNSVKTIATNLIEAGMKPSALVLERWSWGNISQDTESARASREELQSAIDWLDEQGIKTMLYMAVGGSYSLSQMAGAKDEYFVHAYINDHGNVRYAKELFSVNVGGVTENPDVSDPHATRLYLDVTNPEAMAWYYDQIWGQLVDMGIDGVKIDFAEQMPDEGYDYNGVSVQYDWYDPSLICKGGEHHSYPVYFISSFYSRMNELKRENGEDDGFFVLSRGGGIGSQRNPYLWAGDQCRTFDKLDDQLMSVVTSGLSGVPFMTYDMAGYRYGRGSGEQYASHGSLDYESEMFALAIAFTAFTTNIQTHGTVRNAYELTDYAQEVYRLYLAFREELTWYITQNVRISCETGIPAVRHPVLEYQDDANVYNINDQFMLGDALMVAPILARDTYERTVYLPEGSWTNLLTGEVVSGGYHTVPLALGQVGLFLNNGSADAEKLLAIFNNSEAWNDICVLKTVLPNLEYKDDLERFADRSEGSKVTRADGFTNEIPSSTAVAKDGDNTYLHVDLAAAGDPNKTVYYKNDSAFTLVTEETAGAIKTDEASYGLISGNDGNINKNLQFNSPEVSYERYKTVTLEVDYYLSEDAKGSIISQIFKYQSKESGFKDANWLYLFEIDAATGAMRIINKTYGSGAKLKRGDWNTIKMVFNMETGKVDYYLNGALYAKDASLGQTCLTLNAGAWIVGKIQRTKNAASNASKDLCGFFAIDNVSLVAEPYKK